MGLFTRDIYIPETLYKILPLLYATAGLLMWLMLEQGIGQLAGLALVVFALVITIKRLRKTGT